MKIVRLAEAETYEPQPQWRRASLCNEREISIERFLKPPHHASPPHEHDNAQVLVVLRGKLGISVGGHAEEVLGEGDAAFIPGGESHVVRNLLAAPSEGIDIFVPGRSFDFWRRRLEESGG